MKKGTIQVALIALIIGAIAGVWISSRMNPSVRGPVAPVAFRVSADSGGDIAGQVSFLNGFAPVAKRTLPAVVNIASSKIVHLQQSPFFSDPFFRQFFGNERQFRMPREQRQKSLGSGVIVNADGYVLTNNHVIAGAEDIKISLADKREFKGHVVGSDPQTDVALVKIDAKGLPVVPFGDSSRTQVGEFALAVGNPFGVGETVTMGIISATGRGGLGIEDYEDFIQTDAAVNPGNSGGALVNVRGELIGINTAIVSGGGGNQGVGFAVPVNMARSVMEEIQKHGKVVRGWLGVSIQPVTADIAKAFGLAGKPRGALVADVTAKSPAERAGIRKGDIILSLNGKEVADSQELRLKVSMLAPGTTASLSIFRDRQERDVTVTLGESPAKAQGEGGTAGPESSGPRLGISVDQLTPQIAREFGLSPDTKGVVVTDVTPGSAADEGGLQKGDVIEEVDRRPMVSTDQFQRAVKQAGNQPLLLLINRSGDHLYVALTPR